MGMKTEIIRTSAAPGRRIPVPECDPPTGFARHPPAARLPRYVKAKCRGTIRDGFPCQKRASWEVFLSESELAIIDWGHRPTLIDGRLLVCGAHCRSFFKKWEKQTSPPRPKSPIERKVERADKWLSANPVIETAKITLEIDSLRDRLRKLRNEIGREAEIGSLYRKEKAEEVEKVERGV